MKVLCIIGCARSGSTVLDAILGNHPGVESVGELVNLPTAGWLRDELCACGEPASRCSYWSEVRSGVEHRLGRFDVERFVETQRRFERTRRLPSVLWQRVRPTAWFARYARQNLAIFEAIATVGGSGRIVDSSKNPVRALALSNVHGLDVSVLHLVRDSRGVAWSLMKPYRRDDAAGVQNDMPGLPAWDSSRRWLVSNALSSFARSRFPEEARGFLRYEDLASDPTHALVPLGRLLDVDVSELARKVGAGEPLTIGHTIAGNRVRMRGTITIRPDVEWKERLSSRDETLTWTMTALPMRRFGYSR